MKNRKKFQESFQTRFTEKLSSLVGDDSLRRHDREARLGNNALSNLLRQKNIPRLDTAFLISQYFGVSLDWIANPDAGESHWPPLAKAIIDYLDPDDRKTYEFLRAVVKNDAECIAATARAFTLLDAATREKLIQDAKARSTTIISQKLGRARTRRPPKKKA